MSDQRPADDLNADQFDDDGLPGIDPNYPPEHAWGAEDPTAVNASANAPDDLETRDARLNPVTHHEEPAASEHDDVPLLIDDAAPLVDGAIDLEAKAVADEGVGDPDAPIAPEVAAMRIVPDQD